jgi:hypothetical protein
MARRQERFVAADLCLTPGFNMEFGISHRTEPEKNKFKIPHIILPLVPTTLPIMARSIVKEGKGMKTIDLYKIFF